ncbi:hypothetical protein [Paenibacillus sp. RC67]|uniref:hypothetical protein n=1 Tax=Paenibacillus sp. RC67 TaxID=3039392 RepID=UPI0024AE46E3|nr:hypothetical protein [Paenibacillus sp. RC67]
MKSVIFDTDRFPIASEWTTDYAIAEGFNNEVTGRLTQRNEIKYNTKKENEI